MTLATLIILIACPFLAIILSGFTTIPIIKIQEGKDLAKWGFIYTLMLICIGIMVGLFAGLMFAITFT